MEDGGHARSGVSTIKRMVIIGLLVVAVVGVLVFKNTTDTLLDHKSDIQIQGSDQVSTQSGKELPLLLDIGAGKCIPCKMMEPILEELKIKNTGRLQVQFIDIWKNPKAGEIYDVKSIPTQIFYGPDGKELYRHTGFYSKNEILKKWSELGFSLEESYGINF
jgi:thioredoxin 1